MTRTTPSGEGEGGDGATGAAPSGGGGGARAGAGKQSSDALFWSGAAPYALVVASLLFLNRLPGDAREWLADVVLSPWRWAVLVLGGVVAAPVALTIVQEVGQERLLKAWAFVRSLGWTSVLAGLNLTLPPFAGVALFWVMATTDLGVWMKSHGLLGVAGYALVFMVLAGIGFLPTYAQAVLGGWAFGLWMGLPGALVGFAGGASIGYAIARLVSGDKVEAQIEKRPKWKVVRDALVGASQAGRHDWQRSFWKTLAMIALLRLPPNSPFAFTNTLLSSIKVPYLPFVLGTVTGMFPRTFLAVAIGAGLREFTDDEVDRAIPSWMIFAGLGATLVIVIVISVLAKRALAKFTAAHAGQTAGGSAVSGDVKA